jgi:heme-binding protein
VARWPLGVVAIVFVAIQFAPHGWWHENPRVVHDAPWPSDETRRIARESCYSCHSNETDWPPYRYVAPMSWLVRSDVEEGGDELNFSEWAEFADESDDAVDVIVSGGIPPARYTLIHRGATLSENEADALIEALLQMEQVGPRD